MSSLRLGCCVVLCSAMLEGGSGFLKVDVKFRIVLSDIGRGRCAWKLKFNGDECVKMLFKNNRFMCL